MRRALPALAVLLLSGAAHAAPVGAPAPSVEVVIPNATGAPGIDPTLLTIAHQQVSRTLQDHPALLVVSAGAPRSAGRPRYTVQTSVEEVRWRTGRHVTVRLRLTFASGGSPVLALSGRARVDQRSGGPRAIEGEAVRGAARSCMSSFDRVALPRLRP